MLLTIEGILTPDEARQWLAALGAAGWDDGARTAGSIARGVKRNQQLPDEAEPARRLGGELLARLRGHPLFVSAALPNRIHPPRFNRYTDGGTYGTHVDNAVMPMPGGGLLRTDLSATLFLAEPETYDGGELEIEGPFGAQAVKLAAGDLVLYPSSSLHRVTPVTRGARVAAILWLESLVADPGDRALLFDLDQAIQALTPTLGPGDERLLALTCTYHNLLRRWAAT